MQQHVGVGREPADDGLSVRVLEVQRQGTLATVVVLEQVGHAVSRRTHVAQDVAHAGRLDLDHVGALVGQEGRGTGRGQGTGQFDDANAVERALAAHGAFASNELCDLIPGDCPRSLPPVA